MNGGVPVGTRLGTSSEMLVIMILEGKSPLSGIEMSE